MLETRDVICQLELDSTATAYEPYSGQTYDITFPTEAGTVYGGTLDAPKGELVVDRAMVIVSASTDTLKNNSQSSNTTRAFLHQISQNYLG